MTKMATYLFDFDGTLVDSMYAYSATMLRVLDENEVDYPEDIIKIITCMKSCERRYITRIMSTT